MDHDNSLNQGGGFPPSPGRFAPFTSPESSLPVKTEPSGSTSLPPLGPVASGGMDSTQLSHDVSQMSDNPSRNLGHRRAQSELFLPDDIGFDFDLGVVGGLDEPSLSDEDIEEFLSMCVDMDMFDSSSTTSDFQTGETSLTGNGASGSLPGHEVTSTTSTRTRHHHSQSMDGSTTIRPEALTSSVEEPSAAEKKKSISTEELAELSITDPKRAKRIRQNRQSAARSKVRKMKYIAELQKKLKSLQTESSMLSTQLTILQGDTTGLNVKNNELKVQLQYVEQQVNLQNALNDSLKEDIQHLRSMTNQMNTGPVFNYNQSFSGNPQLFANNHPNARPTMSASQQLQQLQINARTPQQQFMYQQLPQQQQLQPHAQSMMQQREQVLQQYGDMNLRGNVPTTYAQYGNSSDMGSRDST